MLKKTLEQWAFEHGDLIAKLADLAQNVKSSVLESPVLVVLEQVLDEDLNRAHCVLFSGRVEEPVDAFKGKHY